MTKTHALLAALLILPTAAQAEAITIGATPEWAPFTSDKVKDGGIAAAVATQAFARVGYEAEHAFMPWSRVEGSLDEGKVDVANCMWPDDGRSGKYLFTDPVVVNRIVFVKPAGDSWEYDGIASLDGKTVAVMKDYGYPQEFQDATTFTKEEGTSFAGNLKKVALERVDLTLDDEIVAKYTVSSELGDVAAKLDFAQQAISEVGCVLAFSASNPGAPEIVAAFNKGLAELKADGTYDQILASYGVN